MQTRSTRKEDVERRWYVVDASDKVLGRMATRVATVLRGKHKPTYTPHVDTGDFVIVINADKVQLTGNKEENKMYHHHTGWVGGIVSLPAKIVRKNKPERIVHQAVKGMLPHGPLGRAMLSKLKIYAGSEHPHAAQKPEELSI